MMNQTWSAAIAAAAVLLLVCAVSEHGAQASVAKHFLNEWAAEIRGGRSVAEDVARSHGYLVLEEVHGLPDHYVLKRRDVAHRSKRSADLHTRKLEDDERVSFVEQQHEKKRVKRGYINYDQLRGERWSRDVAREIVKREGHLDDPSFDHMWYLNPTNSHLDAATDLKVMDVWRKGITGKNIVITILDDGIEKNHTDIIGNYDPDASFDVNDNDTDPQPRYEITNENKHGTRCAGEVSMMANNENCGVGIAFDSKIGGIRMLDGTVTDRTEAFSLGFKRDYVDIYSASWGPNDDGKTTEKPGRLVAKALEMGVKEGRGGKGSIFAWASGNGGRVGDNCNSDGYASSIYTLSVSSATQFGHSPWYAEKCASSLASTYSSGTMIEGKVVTADLRNTCTEEHTGTSAAAPLAAGIFALLLEANSELTWRDVQHITIHSANMIPLALEDGWYRNAAGYCVNLAFGFGLMDALAMVNMANPAIWESVGEQHICRVEVQNTTSLPINLTSGHTIEVEFKTDGCKGQDSEVNFLEHLQVVFDLSYPVRGVIYAELESPSGTITILMQERHYDKSRDGFKEWPLMSVHTWGEDPAGTWKFRVADRTDNSHSGQLTNVELVLYGTEEKPAYRPKTFDHCKDVSVTADPTRFGMIKKQRPLVDVMHETLERLQKLPPQSSQSKEEIDRLLSQLESKDSETSRFR